MERFFVLKLKLIFLTSEILAGCNNLSEFGFMKIHNISMFYEEK